MSTPATFLWHDYETFGTSPQKDLPCQFAAVRTDADLNIVGKPINIISQIANDYLPSPQACLITGITPQQTLRDGMIEAEFARQIFAHMSEPNTCVVGYNSLRFDDEVTRHLFYRNFLDPYSREWRNGNSRWDIIDLARACYALRPEGIHWPTREDGSPSFKLEILTEANNLDHGQAHDALSDVYATIGLAKLIKNQQPKLFDYAFALRDKHRVARMLNTEQPTAVLHVSSKLPASQGCATWVMPVGIHPHNPNAVVCIDLSKSPQQLFDTPTDVLRERLYASADTLGDPALRPGLKLIHINRSPFVTSPAAMTDENAERLGLDKAACRENFNALKQSPDARKKAVAVFDEPHTERYDDPDHALYSSGFLNQEERRWCEQVNRAKPDALSSMAELTHNNRLKNQLFRYRARNYPQTLTADEMQKWQAHRQARLTDPGSPAAYTLEPFMFELESLAQEYASDINRQRILKALYQYAENL
ncbi:exodeoxyribonuclease I [Alteromonas aestuariivivens]|uniref:Exodeoxyribonuclease I n=1 Tax=Alteromonas aestuariivivens TaxID=1938339 RepID=A0A3D8MAR4_9ALTE|nr:exodeoxyribonuclease I [Alteromonas aestuariivivens]RDV27454.1 exodeoxyribonuclease I [Alteromonas aestuariivivens]